FYANLAELDPDAPEPLLVEAVAGLRAEVREARDQALARLYRDASRESIGEEALSTLLNVNRALYLSSQSLLRALGHHLLAPDTAGAVEGAAPEGGAGQGAGPAPGSVPAEDDLARPARFHQVEALLELVGRELVAQHLVQGETRQHQLGHLVPGLVHPPAVDAVQGEALEDHAVPVDAGALRQQAEQGDLAAV